MKSAQERRGAPRLAHELPVTIGHPEGEFSVQTKNVSASGAHCVFKRFVAPMTKLDIRLQLSNPHQRTIVCQGVVVRIDPPQADPQCRHYDVAIFFSDIAEVERLSLADYVQRHLHSTSSRS